MSLADDCNLVEGGVMILLLGANGYMGSAFKDALFNGDEDYHVVPRELYTDAFRFTQRLEHHRPDLVINCAAFITTPSVDLCKNFPAENFQVNTALPLMLALACEHRGIPIMHLSTCCLFDEQREYFETDLPTRDLKGHCGAYLTAKLGAENGLMGYPKHYILRLRLPFDELDHPRNYITKLAGFSTVYDHVNSLTHRGDFVKAALDLWRLRVPHGIYHVVNPGHVSAMETLNLMGAAGLPLANGKLTASLTTGCKLSTAKLLSTGVKIRNVHEALDSALTHWRKA